jgi:hypothetical protein
MFYEVAMLKALKSDDPSCREAGAFSWKIGGEHIGQRSTLNSDAGATSSALIADGAGDLSKSANHHQHFVRCGGKNSLTYLGKAYLVCHKM